MKYKWKLACSLTPVNESINEEELKSLGRKRFSDTKINITNINLSNHSFPSFFNQGYIHKLANNLEVGWHPNYKDIIDFHE